MTQRKQRITRKARTNRLGKMVLGILLVLVVALLLWRLGLWALNRINLYMVGFETSIEGCLEETLSGQALVVNAETLVKAPRTGRFENCVMEGERIRKGSLVGYLYPEGGLKIPVRAPVSGVVCYHPDNLEEVLAGSNLEEEGLNVFHYSPQVANDGSFLMKKGQPLFRVIDNLNSTRVVMAFDRDQMKKTATKEDSFVLMYQGQELGKAYCRAVRSEGDQVVLNLELEQFAQPIMDERKPELELVFYRYHGIIVPEDSLVKSGKVQGLFYLDRETIHFREVEALFINDGKAVVRGIDGGKQVVTTPSRVCEGMILR